MLKIKKVIKRYDFNKQNKLGVSKANKNRTCKWIIRNLCFQLSTIPKIQAFYLKGSVMYK